MSWVVTHKESGEVIGEFDGKSLISKVNTEKYRVERVKDYLERINREIASK